MAEKKLIISYKFYKSNPEDETMGEMAIETKDMEDKYIHVFQKAFRKVMSDIGPSDMCSKQREGKLEVTIDK